jgi:hypothetical protein
MTAIGLGFAYAATTVSVFFNVGLVACASRRMHGQPASLRQGLGDAIYCLPQVLAWAAFSVTVGFLLRQLEERMPLGAGRLVVSLILGVGWGVATFFIVPELVFGNGGVFASFKESAKLVRRRWGDAALLGVGVGSASFAITMLPTALLVLIGLAGSGMTFYVLAGIWYVGASIVCATVRQIYLTALYDYVTVGREPVGFLPADMEAAFRDR